VAAIGLSCALGGCHKVFGLDDLTGGPEDAAPDTPRPDGEPAGCPASYNKILEQTASRYRIVDSGDSWISAADACAADAQGLTHLIVLSNPSELAGIIADRQHWIFGDTWIGATDVKTNNGTWKWVTNEITNYVVPAEPGVDPWEPSQPDKNGTCAELRGDTITLHDENCGDGDVYICECDAHANIATVYR